MSSPQTFEFPEFYSFPPFFTLQTNPTTRAKQLEMWSDLVHKWCSANKIKEIQVAAASKLPVFSNKEINRELDDNDVITILDAVQTNGYGVWTLTDKSIFGFSDMKIPELATALYKWADDFNKMNNISTLEEIANGYESDGQTFHGMPLPLLHRALLELEKTGRVALVEGEDLQEMGVKFLSFTDTVCKPPYSQYCPGFKGSNTESFYSRESSGALLNTVISPSLFGSPHDEVCSSLHPTSECASSQIFNKTDTLAGVSSDVPVLDTIHSKFQSISTDLPQYSSPKSDSRFSPLTGILSENQQNNAGTYNPFPIDINDPSITLPWVNVTLIDGDNGSLVNHEGDTPVILSKTPHTLEIIAVFDAMYNDSVHQEPPITVVYTIFTYFFPASVIPLRSHLSFQTKDITTPPYITGMAVNSDVNNTPSHSFARYESLREIHGHTVVVNATITFQLFGNDNRPRSMPFRSLVPHRILSSLWFHHDYDDKGVALNTIPVELTPRTYLLTPRLGFAPVESRSSSGYFMYPGIHSVLPAGVPTLFRFWVDQLYIRLEQSSIITFEFIKSNTGVKDNQSLLLLSDQCQPDTVGSNDDGGTAHNAHLQSDRNHPPCSINNRFIPVDQLMCVHNPSQSPFFEVLGDFVSLSLTEDDDSVVVNAEFLHPIDLRFDHENDPYANYYSCDFYVYLIDASLTLAPVSTTLPAMLQSILVPHTFQLPPTSSQIIPSYQASATSLTLTMDITLSQTDSFPALFKSLAIIGIPFGIISQYMSENPEDTIRSSKSIYFSSHPRVVGFFDFLGIGSTFRLTFDESDGPLEDRSISFSIEIPYSHLTCVHSSEFSTQIMTDIDILTGEKAISPGLLKVVLDPEGLASLCHSNSVGWYTTKTSSNDVDPLDLVLADDLVQDGVYFVGFSLSPAFYERLIFIHQSEIQFSVTPHASFQTQQLSCIIHNKSKSTRRSVVFRVDLTAQLSGTVLLFSYPSQEPLVLEHDMTLRCVLPAFISTREKHLPIRSVGITIIDPVTETIINNTNISFDSGDLVTFAKSVIPSFVNHQFHDDVMRSLVTLRPQTSVQLNSDITLDLVVDRFPIYRYASGHLIRPAQSLFLEFPHVIFTPQKTKNFLRYYTMELVDDSGDGHTALFRQVEHSLPIWIVISALTPSRIYIQFDHSGEEDAPDPNFALQPAMPKFAISGITVFLPQSTPQLDGHLTLEGPFKVARMDDLSHNMSFPVRFPTIYDLSAAATLVPGRGTPTASAVTSPMRIKFTVATVALGEHFIDGPYPLAAVDSYCMSEYGDIMGEISLVSPDTDNDDDNDDGEEGLGTSRIRMYMNPSARSIQCVFYADIFFNYYRGDLSAQLSTIDGNDSDKQYTVTFTFPKVVTLPPGINLAPNADFTLLTLQIYNAVILPSHTMDVEIYRPFPHDTLDNNTRIEYETHTITYSDPHAATTEDGSTHVGPIRSSIKIHIAFHFPYPVRSFDRVELEPIHTYVPVEPRPSSIAIINSDVGNTITYQTITIPAVSSEYDFSFEIAQKTTTVLMFSITSTVLDIDGNVLYVDLHKTGIRPSESSTTCVFIDHQTQTPITMDPHPTISPALYPSTYMPRSSYVLSVVLPRLLKDQQIDVLCDFPPMTVPPSPNQDVIAFITETATGKYVAQTATTTIPYFPVERPVPYVLINFNIDGYYKRDLPVVSIHNLIFEEFSDLLIGLDLRSTGTVHAGDPQQQQQLPRHQQQPLSQSDAENEGIPSDPRLGSTHNGLANHAIPGRNPRVLITDIILEHLQIRRVYNSTGYFLINDLPRGHSQLAHLSTQDPQDSPHYTTTTTTIRTQDGADGNDDIPRSADTEIAPATIFSASAVFKLYGHIDVDQLSARFGLRRRVSIESTQHHLVLWREGDIVQAYDDEICLMEPFCGIECKTACANTLPCRHDFDCLSLYCNLKLFVCEDRV